MWQFCEFNGQIFYLVIYSVFIYDLTYWRVSLRIYRLLPYTNNMQRFSKMVSVVNLHRIMLSSFVLFDIISILFGRGEVIVWIFLFYISSISRALYTNWFNYMPLGLISFYEYKLLSIAAYKVTTFMGQMCQNYINNNYNKLWQWSLFLYL